MGKKEKRLQKKTANKSSNITTSTPNKEDSQSSSGYKVSDQPSSNQFKDSTIYSGVDDTRSRCGNSSPNKEDSLSSSVGDQSSSNQFKDSEHSKVEKTRTSSRNFIHNKEDSQSSYGDEVNDPSSSNTFNKHARVNGRHRNSSPRNEERNRNWPSGNQSSSSFGKKGRSSKNYPINSKDSTENGSIETPIKNYDGFKKEIEGEGNSSKKENQSSSMQGNYSTDSNSTQFNSTPNRSCYRSFSKQKIFMRNDTDEKSDFCSYLISGEAENDSRVKEVEGNLFEVDEDYALAHCVAQDMNMGSGIAIEFRNRFNKVPELLSQHAKTGGLAILEKKGRFIYYLVTKSVSQGKPTYDSLWSSLCKLREHMKANNVKKLAMPRIGCGLDRLDWDVVWRMLKYLFRSEDSDILVCNFQPASTTPTTPLRKCKVVQVIKPITEIEPETVIIYFASKDGHKTETMKDLNRKFKIENDWTKAPKVLGQTVRSQPMYPRNYVLYGCIVQNKYDEPMDFMAFAECLKSISKNSIKDGFYFVAFQQEQDEILNAQILTLMRYNLRDVDIYVCGCIGPLE